MKAVRQAYHGQTPSFGKMLNNVGGKLCICLDEVGLNLQ